MHPKALASHQAGLAYEQHGDLQAAAAEYEKALALDPRLELTRTHLAAVRHQLGEYEAAIGHYRQLVEAQPDDLKLLYNLGASYSAAGKSTEAAPLFLRCARLDPTFVPALSSLVWVYRQQGDSDSAIAVLGQLSKLEPENLEVQYQLAELLRQQGRQLEAIAQLEGLIAQNSGHFAGRLLLADLLAERDAESAWQQLSKVWEKDPGFVGSRDLAERIVLQALGQAEGARDRGAQATWLDRKILMGQRDPASVRRLADLYRDLDRTAKAAALYQELHLLDPADLDLSSVLASCLKRLGKRDEARGVLEGVLQARPDDPEALLMQADLLAETGRPAEAKELLAHLLSLDPGHRAARIKLAHAEALLGDEEGAYQIVHDLVQGALTDFEIRREAASFCRKMAASHQAGRTGRTGGETSAPADRQRSLEATARWWERYLEFEPEDAKVLETLGGIYRQSLAHADAARIYESLARIRPDPAVWHLLGSCRMAAGDPAGAASAFQTALERTTVSRLASGGSAESPSIGGKTAPAGLGGRDPSVATRMALAEALLAQQDVAGALAAARDVLAREPGHSLAAPMARKILVEQAQEATAQGRHPEAADLWREAIKLGRDADSLRQLADALERVDDAPGAAWACEQLLALNPTDRHLLQRLGELALATRRTDEARRWFTELLASDPQNLRAMVALADLAWGSGDRATAYDLYERAVALDPGHIPGVLAFARDALASDQPGEAWEYARRILAQHPQHAEAVAIAGEALGRLAKAAPPQSALAWWQSLCTLHPEDKEALRGLWRCYRALGGLAEAAQAAQRILALDPLDAEAALYAAEQERRAGRVDAARAALRPPAEAGDPDCLLELSAIERASADWPAVRACLGRLVAARPDDVDAIEGLAEADLAEGHGSEAWASLEPLLKDGRATFFGRKMAGEAARATARAAQADAAIGWWRRVLVALENDPEAMRALIGLYAQAGDHETASRVAKALLAQAPDRDAAFFLADYHADRGEWGEVAKVLHLVADDPKAAYLLAKIAWQNHDAAAARGHLEQLHRHVPRHRGGALLLAQIATERGDLEEAYSALTEVLALDPEDPVAGAALPDLCRQAAAACEERPDAAASWCRRLVAFAPDDLEARADLAGALARARMHAEAAEAYHELGGMAPEDARWPAREADCLLLAGHPREAAVALARARELAPDDPGVTLTIALLAEQAERFEQAYVAGCAVLAHLPSPTQDPRAAQATRIALHACLKLAEQARIAGDPAGMATHLERAAALDPQNLQLVRALGDACRMGQDALGAARAFERAFELAPADLEIAFLAGEMYRAGQELASARRLFLKILERKPDHLPTLLVLAGLLWQDGDLAGARWYLKRILADLDAAAATGTSELPSEPLDGAALREQFERQIAAGRAPAPQEARRQVLLMLAGVALEEKELDDAFQHAEAALALCEDSSGPSADQARATQIKILGAIGDRALEAGNLDAARRAWKQAVHLAPEERGSFRRLAEIEQQAGNLEEAARMFGVLWETDHRDVAAALALGSALAGQGLRSEARRAYEEAAAASAGPEAAIALAELAWEDGDPDGTWRWAQAARSCDPDYARARDWACDAAIALATRARDAGNSDQERAWWELLAELAPVGRERLLALARGQVRMNAPELAAATLLQLKEECPGDPEVAFELAETLKLAGDLEGAMLNYRRIILGVEGDREAPGEEDPSPSARIRTALAAEPVVTGQVPISRKERALLELARIGMELGRAEEAWEWSQALLSIRPDHGEAKELASRCAADLAEAAEREDDLDSALLYRQVFLALRPQDQQGTLALARVHLAAGRSAEAIALYRDLLGRHPNEVAVKLALADALVAADPAAASAHYQEILEIHPRHPGALSALAGMAERTGDPARAFGLYGQAAEASDDPTPYQLAQAEIAWRTDRAFETWELSGQILARDPGHPRATELATQSCRRLAEQAHKRGVLAQEREHWEALVELVPDSQDALRELGRIAREDRDFTTAERLLEKALDQDPGDRAAAFELGLLNMATGNRQGARTAFMDILEQDPYQAGTLLEIAQLDWDEGDPDGAWYHVQELLALEPTNAAGLALFTKLARRFAERTAATGDLKSSIEWWQLAVRQSPKDTELLRELAEARVQGGDFEGAAVAFGRLLELSPGDLDAAHRAADTYRHMGDWARAEAALRRVVELDPHHAASLRSLLKLTREQGNAPEVMNWAYALLDLDPKDPDALFQLAWAHNTLLEKKAALVTFEELLKQQPQHAASWHQAAILYRDLGDLDAARKAATNAIVYGPKPECHVTLGTIYGRMGLWDEAVAAFSQALVLQPDYADALAQLGFGLLQLRRPDQARPHLERAITLLPRGEELALSVRCALDLM